MKMSNDNRTLDAKIKSDHWEDLEYTEMSQEERSKTEALIQELSYWAEFLEDPSMNAMTPSERLRKRVRQLQDKLSQ